jgi:hypothetical protein
MDEGERLPWDREEAVAVGLVLDAAAAEAVSALGKAGVGAVLLKGASFERLLYDPGEPRMYGDIDLLVAAEQLRAAARVLEALGYRPRQAELSPRHVDHAKLWVRDADRMNLDLHRSLVGVGAGVDPWTTLSAETETMEIGGASLEVLSPAARAMHVALHATVHANDPDKPMADLSRALERLPEATWGRAAELARELDAEGAFRAGLRMLPAGEALADRLGLSAAPRMQTVMFQQEVPSQAWTVDRLARAPGLGAKLRIVARRAFPEPEFMRAWYPLARRGRWGLALSYVRRVAWLAKATGPAVLAWVRARRELRRG